MQKPYSKKVYAYLPGYAESFYSKSNFYDFTYLGGPVLLIFEHLVLELGVEGTGMVKYRTMKPWDIKIRHIFGVAPYDLATVRKANFYDLGSQFDPPCEELGVAGVTVENADDYAFCMNGFDEVTAEAACKANRLPNALYFHLENGMDFCILPDDLEYFYITLRESSKAGS